MLVAGSAWLGRMVTAFAGLVTIRLLMQNLGAEQYAVFAVLGGVQGWFMLADMGIASSLQNFISERRAHDQQYQDYVATAGVFSLLIAMAFILLLGLAAGPIAGAMLKNFTFLPQADRVRCFFMVGAVSIATCVGTISYRIWYAEQKGYLANILPAAASLLSLAGIMLVARLAMEHRLYWSLAAVYLPAAALPLIAFSRQLQRSFSGGCAIDRMVLSSLVRRGLKFWGFALMSNGVLQVDYLIMSQFLEPRQIVSYNFATKIYALVFFVYGAVLSAIWPICAEAVSRREWDLVKGYIRKYTGMGIALIAVSTALLMVFMSDAVQLLAPKEMITIPTLFILLLGGYQMIRVWTDTYGMVLQSMSYLRPFWLYIPFQVIINVLLQWLLVPTLGVYGVVLGLVGSFVMTAAWVLPASFAKRVKESASPIAIP